MAANRKSARNGHGKAKVKRKHTGAGRKARRILLVLSVLLFLVFPVLNGIGYEFAFSRIRIEMPEEQEEAARAFPYPGTEIALKTSDGKDAYGVFYSDPLLSAPPKAVIVFSPGISAQGLQYAPLFEALIRENYAILSVEDRPQEELKTLYSDGEDHRDMIPSHDGGLPESVLELEAAISYVSDEKQLLSSVPCVLIGHSRGAYAAGAVLSFKDPDAAILIAPFDSSGEMLLQKATAAVGPIAYLFWPYARLYELIKFGPYAASSVTKGVLESDTDILLIQGMEDRNIPPEQGILHFEESLKDDPDVRFIKLEKTGHTPQFDDAFLTLILDHIESVLAE